MPDPKKSDGRVMFKKISLVLIFVLMASVAFSQVSISGRGYGGRRDYVPSPKLLSPIQETVSLKGKEELTFKWSPHRSRSSGSKYYDFRLYGGYNMVESSLILKEQVPGNKHSISLGSGQFKNGEIYTWSVRQVYRGIGKSDRSFSSFKVTE